MFKKLENWVLMGCLLGASLALAACGGTAAPIAQAPPTGQELNRAANLSTAYRLGSGDEVRVNVFGEENLSGQFEIDGEGGVSLPLIGYVEAAGLTLRDFEGAVENALQDGYLRDPQVSAEVLNFRPYYIIGEVGSGGEFPYSHGMTVLNAVAIAGGYSYRADRRRVIITRIVSGVETEHQADPSASVLPGDVIRVRERFF